MKKIDALTYTFHAPETWNGHVPSLRFGKENIFQKLAELPLRGIFMEPT